MPSFFPGSQDSFVTKVDNVTTVLAADVNNLQSAISAIEIGGVSVQNIAYAASITPNVSSGEYAIVGALTGNITVNAPTNAATGRRLTLRFTQDATGGRTVTWNAVFKVTNWTVNTTANAKTEATFTYDGTNWVLAVNPTAETNPTLATYPLYDAGGMVINAAAASVTLTPINTGVAQTITLGMKGDRVFDNATTFQNLLTALAVLNDADGTTGAYGFIPAGAYIYRTQPKYTGNAWSLRGAGMRSTTLQPRTFTGFALIADTAGTFPYADILIEDLRIEGWNHTNNQGGIVAEGCLRMTLRRVFFDGFKGTGVQVLGHGTASSGDSMFATIEECQFNPQNVAGIICIQLSNGASNGSHPDAFRAINNWVNGNANTTFFKVDVAGVGGVSAGQPLVAFNRVEGCAIFCDINTQAAEFIGNWAEITAGTMTITIQAGPASYPSRGNKFIGGTFATYGDRTKLTITDNGINTDWVAVGNVGTAKGQTTGNLSGGTATLETSISSEWLLALSANTTVNVTNPVKGQRQGIKITHDGTATAFTLTWQVNASAANVKFAGGAFGTNKAGTNTANAVDWIEFNYDGTLLFEVNRALALA